MKVPVENKIRLGLVIGIAALLGFGWLSYYTTTRLVATEDWVAHTHEVIAQLEALRATVTEEESSLEGYLVSGSPQFLADRQATVQRLFAGLQQLRALTADNPSQQHDLDRLTSLVTDRLHEQDERLARFRQSGLAAASDAAGMLQGRAETETIRALIDAMRSTENRLLAERSRLSRDEASRSLTVVLAGSLLACVVVLAALVSSNRDFRLRARAEEKSRESRALLEAILDNSPAVIFIKDREGHYQFVNRRYQQLAGLPFEQIIGRTDSEIFRKEIAQSAREHDLKVLECGEPLEFEETVIYPDGRPHTHLVIKFPLRDAGGRVYAIGGVSSDISQRLHAEEALRHAEERQRQIIENIKDYAIIMLNPDGQIVTWNGAAERIKGYATDEIVGRHFSVFYPAEDLATGLPERALATARAEGRFQHEGWRVRKDGSQFWAEVIITTIRDASGTLQGFVKVTRDLTERKKADEHILQLNGELQRRAEQLEASNKELEAFSYSVSHDLRAPVRHIDGFVKIWQKQAGDNFDERGRRYLGIIADSARQMGTLIDDLLVFSRMSRTELHRAKVALNSLVHEAMAAIQMETDDRRIDWNIGNLPEVEADPAMLRQVFINLVANAVKYTRPRDPAKIEVGCADSANGDFVIFVRDNGVGFDMQYAHKLFGVFQRLHRAEDFEGTGIGLANVRRIITRHGGRTWAEGKPDAGATFYFTLPKQPTAPGN